MNLIDRPPAILGKVRKEDIVILFNHDQAEFVLNYGVSSTL